MTDPSPDTQQIEMLKTLLHDSRTERTRLADEVDRLRALADPAPVGLTEDERRKAIRDGLHRWLEWHHDGVEGDYDEGAGFIIESLDRLSAAPVDDREPYAEWVNLAAPIKEVRIDIEDDSVPVSPSVDPEEG